MIHSYIQQISEKLTHSGFQRYFKNMSWLVISRILCMVISFITTAFIARQLGPTNFGQLSYAISFVAVFSFLASLGIDGIVYRDLVKFPEKKMEYLGTALGIKLSASIFTSIVIIISAITFAEDDVSKILIIILSFTFIFNSFLVVNNDFQASVRSKAPALISLIVTVILNTLKVVVIFYDKGVIYLSLILLLETILYATFYWLAYEKILGGRLRNWKFDKLIAKSLLHDSWPAIFSAAFALIYARIDQIFIKHMIDATAVGIYDSAVRVAETWYFLPSIAIGSLFPAIVNAKKTDDSLYNARLKQLIVVVLILTFSISLITVIFAPFIVKLLYGAAFIGGTKVLQIYIWSAIAISLSTIISSYLIIENYRKILFITNLVPMISNIVLNILWIPHYGIIGSAYATLVSYILGPLCLLFFSKTRKRIKLIYREKIVSLL